MNILHIHSHDTGKLISPYGYNLPTPNLEKLAEEMITFDNYYTVSPTCTPSRSATLTGTYPSKNGLVGLGHRGFELQRKDLHLANVLKDNGYNTILCGIQHEIGKYDDIDREVTKTLGYQSNITCEEECGEEIWDLNNLQNTLEYINNYDSDKPFFISHGTFSTHRPYYKSQEKMKSTYYGPSTITTEEVLEDNANFQYSVSVYDKIIGELISAIKAKGIYDDTLIIISTDHGVANPEYKCNLNDEGTNIMLMMHVPGHKGLVGNKCFSLLSNIDIAPTIYDIVGIQASDELDGTSFKSVLTGEKTEINDSLFFELNYHTSHEPAISIRTKDHRLTIMLDESYDNINWSNIDNSPVKEEYYKLFANSKKNMEYFIDYRKQTNLFKTDDEDKDVYNQLRNELLKWNEERFKIDIDESKLSVNNKTDYNPSVNKG